jgi:membrane-bound ClpP family serine protease
MTPATLAIFLFVAGVVLMLGETVLPTQGVLGVIGGGAILGAVGVGFYISQWLGLGMLLGTVLLSPFVAIGAMNVWPKTPVGRRMVLHRTETTVQPPHVGLGQIGTAVSELRPMGWCEFDDKRHEVRSEAGVIQAGRQVKVVSVESGRLIVREV